MDHRISFGLQSVNNDNNKKSGYTSESMTHSGGSSFDWRNSLLDSNQKLFTTSHKPNIHNLRQGHIYDLYYSEMKKMPGRHRDRRNSAYSSKKAHNRQRVN